MTDNSFDRSLGLLASIMGANEYDKDDALLLPQNNGDDGQDNMILDDDDDDDEQHPFDIDHYKLVHEPGMSQCRGRNILTILEDRSVRGPRSYCYHTTPPPPPAQRQQAQQDDDNGGDDDTIGMASSSSQREELSTPPVKVNVKDEDEDDDNNEMTMMMVEDNDNNNIAATPEQNNRSNNIHHHHHPFDSTSYHSPTPGMATTDDQHTPLNDTATETTQRQQQLQTTSAFEQPNATKNTHSSSSSSSNQTTSSSSSSPPTDPTNITTELTSFIEYAAATKFRGSYLQHLRGDAPVHPPPPPPPRYPMGRNTTNTANANASNHNNNNNYSNIGSSGDWSTMTREQRETQRQLQQHLQQQHNAANRNREGLPRRGGGGMNQVRLLPSANGANDNNSNNNNNEGAVPPNNPIPNNFPSRRGVPPAAAPPRHRRPPNNNNNNSNNTTNAVSTISIDFSPNGRTLASTHGDHTVKITCAHTGKLLRELDGHPRTPWTVKYHPTNYRIVASGCLGCQVRVWDWNFQTERVRKERREGVERRWGGRYHLGNGGGGSRSRETTTWNTGRGGFTSSPRGVVDQHWKGGGGVGVNDERMDCTNATSNESASSGVGSWEVQYRQHAKATAAAAAGAGASGSGITSADGAVEDDYAAYALAAMGVPMDDPAWYDTESEVYNYEKGMGVCLHMIRLNHAIISLSFHPSGEVLAIASGSTLHLWDYDEEKRKKRDALLTQQRQTTIDENNPSQSSHSLLDTIRVRETDDRILNRHQNQNFPNGRTMDFAHDSALRCVHFPPSGDTIIIGGVNPQSFNEGLPNARRERGGMQGGGMSFHLRLWDFSLDAVLDPCTQHRPTAQGAGRGSSALGGRISDEGDLAWNFYVTKETMTNPRTIIPRVLLYNDGGFDMSKDGTVLSACAEFWLPDGVNSAMELIQSLREIEEKAETTVDNGHSNTSDDLSRSPPRYLSPSRPKLSAFPDPRTPPPNNSYAPLEPPSPPGKRNMHHVKRGVPIHNPHPLSMVAASHPLFQGGGGRYVPHIVTVSLDSSPPPDGELMQLDPKVLRTESMRKYPKLGQLLMAAPLDGTKASGVTCVKLSPSAEYCLLGYGVRENIPSVDGLDENRHPVTALYDVKKGMKHVSTLTSADDDVNIARFHPESGHGFVYGTKQGRVRVLSTRVWNHYHVDDE